MPDPEAEFWWSAPCFSCWSPQIWSLTLDWCCSCSFTGAEAALLFCAVHVWVDRLGNPVFLCVCLYSQSDGSFVVAKYGCNIIIYHFSLNFANFYSFCMRMCADQNIFLYLPWDESKGGEDLLSLWSRLKCNHWSVWLPLLTTFDNCTLVKKDSICVTVFVRDFWKYCNFGQFLSYRNTQKLLNHPWKCRVKKNLQKQQNSWKLDLNESLIKLTKKLTVQTLFRPSQAN